MTLGRPNPTPGETLELGFLGSVLHVEIPHSLDVQQVATTSSFNEKYDPRSHVCAPLSPMINAELRSDIGHHSTISSTPYAAF